MKIKNYIIGIVVIATILVLGYIIYDASSLSCRGLAKSRSEIEINQNCQVDSDCILGGTGWCGSCVNKDESSEKIKRLGDIYNKGIEKECFPQFQCMQSRCKCVDNRCISETISKNEIKITDSLLTKDKEICSPSSDDGTPYCNELFNREFRDNSKYSIIVHELCPETGESPEEIIVYNTLNDLIPPSGKARNAYYCSSLNQFWVSDYDSEKVPMPYWYGPFGGYPIIDSKTNEQEKNRVYTVAELINSELPEGQYVKVRGIMGPCIQLKVPEDYEGPGSGCILTSSDYNEKNKGYSIHIGKGFPEYNEKEIIVSGLVRYCGGNKIPRYICGLTNVEFIDSIQ